MGGGQVGLYHAVLLPAILLEMDAGSPGLLAALDLVCLCAAGAGVCAATALLPPPPAAAAAGLHGEHRPNQDPGANIAAH